MGRPWFGWGDWRKRRMRAWRSRGRLAANDPRFYLFVGHALAAAGQAARAAEALKKALDLVPADARVAWEVARALRAASSPEAAGAFMLAGRRFLILRRFRRRGRREARARKLDRIRDGRVQPGDDADLVLPVYRQLKTQGWTYFKVDALRHLRYEGYNSHAGFYLTRGIDRVGGLSVIRAANSR